MTHLNKATSRHAATLALALALGASTAHAEGDHHGQQIPNGGVAPRFVVDSRLPTWPASVLNYAYNPANQPASISTAQMETLLQNAARKWSNVCNVRFNYLGTTTAVPSVESTWETIDRKSVVGWGPLVGSKAGFAAYVAWWYDGTNALVDADMVINTSTNEPFSSATLANLGALVTHEFGHMLAIKHSDQQQSVMFANPYNTYSFQSTLRGDDVAACASLYGESSTAKANRVFNWAEQSFSQVVAPTGTSSTDLAGGIHYRHYTGTNTYLALYNGQLYFLDGALKPQLLGAPETFLPSAQGAGF